MDDGSMERAAPGERAGEAPPPAVPHLCPHCRHARLQRWGACRGTARLRCGGCRRTFSAVTGTLAAGLRRRAAFEAAVADMLGPAPSSCRVLAARLGVHRMTVWRWRMRVLARFARSLPVPADPEGGVASTRESRKASREWVNHARWPELFPRPPRPCWRDLAPGEAPPGGWEAWRIGVLLHRSGTGVGIACRRGRPGRGEWRSPDCAGDLQGRLDRFLAPFRGPATRHLGGYVAWMAVREAVGRGGCG